jgi:hypothetical protein
MDSKMNIFTSHGRWLIYAPSTAVAMFQQTGSVKQLLCLRVQVLASPLLCQLDMQPQCSYIIVFGSENNVGWGDEQTWGHGQQWYSRLWPELVHGFKNLTQQVTVMLSRSPLLTAEYKHQVFDELQRFCWNVVVQWLQATEANVKLVYFSFWFSVLDCHLLCKEKAFDIEEVSFLIIPHNQ